jgi:hypothetical protein
MQIQISVEQLERVEKLLYGIPGAIPTAEANAFNRGMEAAKTEAKRQIQQRYAITQGNLGKYNKTKIQRASAGGTEAYIEFRGPKVPLYKYTPAPKSRTYVAERIPVMIHGVGWRNVFKSGDVSAMDSRESGMVARPAGFIATFKSGHTGIFKRTGGSTSTGNAKIKEYWGYSVADMLDYEPAREAIQKKTEETVNKRLEHEITRILSRY